MPPPPIVSPHHNITAALFPLHLYPDTTARSAAFFLPDLGAGICILQSAVLSVSPQNWSFQNEGYLWMLIFQSWKLSIQVFVKFLKTIFLFFVRQIPSLDRNTSQNINPFSKKSNPSSQCHLLTWLNFYNAMVPTSAFNFSEENQLAHHLQSKLLYPSTWSLTVSSNLLQVIHDSVINTHKGHQEKSRGLRNVWLTAMSSSYPEFEIQACSRRHKIPDLENRWLLLSPDRYCIPPQFGAYGTPISRMLQFVPSSLWACIQRKWQ